MAKKQDINQDTDILKKQVLEKENKKEYRSERFSKIETQVKDALKRQATDDALRDISIGALVVGSSDIHYEAYEQEVIVRFRID